MKIAISGAGVAGVSLAHWLRRIGHTPTLIEQAPAFRTGGYMIDFWGVGYRVARRMGIEERIQAAGYDVRYVRTVGSDGDPTSELDVDVLRRVIGNDMVSLPRGDLAAAIYAGVAGTVETIFGDSIATIDDRSERLGVTFARAAPREFDLVVGADGLHSNVRGLVFGPAEDFEHYLGCKVAACVVDGYRPRNDQVYVTYAIPGGQVGRFTLHDDRSMFLFVFRAEQTSALPPKEQLHDMFGDAGWECPRILAALDDVDDLYFDVVSQIRMDSWSRGRVALIGDAAACISLLGGEGTGLAITEAYVMAGELKRAGNDYRGAFEAYEALLRPFIIGKQSGAEKMIAFFATRTRLGLWLRNKAIRTMNLRPLTALFAGRIRDDIELPEYGIAPLPKT